MFLTFMWLFNLLHVSLYTFHFASNYNEQVSIAVALTENFKWIFLRNLKVEIANPFLEKFERLARVPDDVCKCATMHKNNLFYH